MEVATDLNLYLGCLETLAHNETDLSRAFQQPLVAFISNQSITDEGNRRDQFHCGLVFLSNLSMSLPSHSGIYSKTLICAFRRNYKLQYRLHS